MSGRRTRLLALLVLAGLPAGLGAQARPFLAGAAGAAFNTDQNTPNGNAAGFAFQAQAGLELRGLSLGGEFGQFRTDGAGKTSIFGGFARFPTFIGQSAIQLYLTLGLGAYRFSPSSGQSSTTAGGSVGPGVIGRLRGTPVSLLAEVRFHSTFDKLPRINNQQFIAVLGGVELQL